MQRKAGQAGADTVAFHFGEFRLDLVREELVGPSGIRVPRRKAFDVLCVLLDAAPAVVAIDDLLDRVWGRHAISASAVPNVIAELRRLLLDDGVAPRYIETRHRRGYRMRERVEREHRVGSDDLLGTLDEFGRAAATLPAARRLEDLRRVASERGLPFLALQAQLALQAAHEPRAAAPQCSDEAITAPAGLR